MEYSLAIDAKVRAQDRMPRFTLFQMLMGVALVCILLGFTRNDRKLTARHSALHN